MPTLRPQYFRRYAPPPGQPRYEGTQPPANRVKIKWVWGSVAGFILVMSMFATSLNKVIAPEETAQRTAMLVPSIPIPALPSRIPSTSGPGLKAFVQLSGTRFIITNLDSFDWRYVKMEISGGSSSGGYSLDRPLIRAGEVYRIEATEFFDPVGNRFDLNQIKPRRFSICADTPNGFTCFVGRLEPKQY